MAPTLGMTAAQHVREAEKLLIAAHVLYEEEANGRTDEDLAPDHDVFDRGPDIERYESVLREMDTLAGVAQVHATLARALANGEERVDAPAPAPPPPVATPARQPESIDYHDAERLLAMYFLDPSNRGQGHLGYVPIAHEDTTEDDHQSYGHLILRDPDGALFALDMARNFAAGTGNLPDPAELGKQVTLRPVRPRVITVTTYEIDGGTR